MMSTTVSARSIMQRAPTRAPAGSRAPSVVVRAMAQSSVVARDKRVQNVAGDFWVDSTCIDCDTCRWMAPEVFTSEGGQSAVTHQPNEPSERVRAMQALLSCPTFSIHNDGRTKDELRAAQEGLPTPVQGVPGVYHCGWHSERSFGAASYLIVRPAGQGNILVDSPRFNPVLLRQIEKLGGADYMFLTHKDDVADHAAWAKALGCVRVLHKEEVRRNTEDVEIQLEGEGPWSWARDVEGHAAARAMRQRKQRPGPRPLLLEGASAQQQHHHDGGRDDLPVDTREQEQEQVQEEDLQLVFTPGHTSHHVCLYAPKLKTLFSGDHLSSPAVKGGSGQLYVFKSVCWFDFPTQLRSVVKLLDYDWLHVLPGHGRRADVRDAAHRLQAVSALMQKHGATALVAAQH